jgi:hypothetical protein
MWPKEVGMYRLRGREQVLYGHFREYLETVQKLRELARERGWAVGRSRG